MTIESIIQDIEAAYGSLEQPNWSFVEKRLRRGLYDDFARDLAELVPFSETTDVNDDWSRCFSLGADDEGLTLRASLVGNYACIHDANARFLRIEDLAKHPMGVILLPLLEQYDLDVLEEGLLRTEMTFNRERTTLYQILFSSDGLIESQDSDLAG